MKGLFLILVVFLFPWKADAQPDGTLRDLTGLFESYSKKNYQEKIYLHLNKPVYLSGETIWFKVYNLDAKTHKKSLLSKYVYVEIIDYEGKPFLQEIVELTDGLGAGQISIPNTMSSGNYYIRAYTNWMRNFGTEQFFTKSLKIINPFKSHWRGNEETKEQWDVQFFPEGGHLLADVVNTVGVKGIDSSGKGFDFSGKVFDNRDSVVAEFQSLNYGMGSFHFIPKKNESYRSLTTVADNSTIIHDLPNPEPFGTSLRVTEMENQFLVQVRQHEPNSTRTELKLIIQAHGEINTQVSGLLIPEETTFRIEKNLLKDGVNQITLFDGNGLPVCERLIFKRPEHLLLIDSEEYIIQQDFRSKVRLNLKVTNQNEPVASDLSVAVYRNSDLGAYEYYDIVTELLLSSELSGHIEHPEYYFKHPDSATDKALDNLMLTQGWRRYSWEDVLGKGNTEYEYIPEFQGYTISGKVRDIKSNAPIENLFAYLTIVDDENKTLLSRSKADGKVVFEAFEYYGSKNILKSLDVNADKNIVLTLNDAFDTQKVQYALKAWDIKASLNNEIIKNSISMQVENNFAPQVKANFSKSETDPFYSGHNQVFRLDDYTRFPTMLETLQENAKGVQVKKNKDGYYLRLFDSKTRKMIDGVPLVFLDGVPVKDFNKIMEMDPGSIDQIDVVFSEYVLGSKLLHGLVNFSSFEESNIMTISSSASMISYQGPQISKEFYVPKYETEESNRSRKPDFRNTLYWNPNIRSNSDGICSFEFYTSDSAGEYIIHVEGIDGGGVPGKKRFLLKVGEQGIY